MTGGLCSKEEKEDIDKNRNCNFPIWFMVYYRLCTWSVVWC
jgi:hypothetical protein